LVIDLNNTRANQQKKTILKWVTQKARDTVSKSEKAGEMKICVITNAEDKAEVSEDCEALGVTMIVKPAEQNSGKFIELFKMMLNEKPIAN